MDAESESEQGLRFIVIRAIMTGDGQTIRIPMMAFDTMGSAQAFAGEEGAWVKSIPQPILDNVLGRLGIARVATQIQKIPTPDGVRRIEVAQMMPPPNGIKLIKT